MNRELLEKTFSPEQIKQREGNFGKMLDYIEGHTVIKRLNDAFEAEWSFSILKHEILEATDEVVVLGELKAGDVIKTQFGSSRITRNRETGEMVSLADDFKAAGTDALKKCATLLGVGLFLYNGDKPSRQNNARSGLSYPKRRPVDRESISPEGGNGGNGDGARITNKQLNYVINLGRQLQWDSKDLDKETLKTFGVKLAFLTVKDASVFIDMLKGMTA
jgi:hypothetical protein